MVMVMYREAEKRGRGKKSKDIAYGDRGEWIEIAARVIIQLVGAPPRDAR